MPEKRQTKQTRPSTTPIPIRFTDTTVDEIKAVAESLGLSQQDVIRLSVSAGLKALKKIGYEGLAEKVSEEIVSFPSKGE